MARARNIKPAFFKNEDLADLDPLARILFIGLWTEADYKGCLEYRPRRLKIEILPYDDCDIEQLMINLEESGFISIYTVAGQRYAKVMNFEKHQNPHKNERDKGSDIPDVSSGEVGRVESLSNINNLQEIENNPDKNGTTPESNASDPADSLLLIPDSLNLIPENPKGENSAAEASGDNSPIELTKSELWAAGKSLLEGAGTPKAQSGSFIGKLVKDHGEEVVLDAIKVAVVDQPADPASYLVGVCRNANARASPQGRQSAVEARNARVMEEMINEGVPK